jgi:hypothetical protein
MEGKVGKVLSFIEDFYFLTSFPQDFSGNPVVFIILNRVKDLPL